LGNPRLTLWLEDGLQGAPASAQVAADAQAIPEQVQVANLQDASHVPVDIQAVGSQEAAR